MATANSIVKLFTGLKKTGMNTSQIATQISNLFKTNRKIYGRLTPGQERVFTQVVQENPQFINRIGNPESRRRIANQITGLFPIGQQIPESRRRNASRFQLPNRGRNIRFQLPQFQLPNRGRNIRFQLPQFQLPNRGRNIRFRPREPRQPTTVMGYPVLPPITQAIVRPPNNIMPKPANNVGPKPPLPHPSLQTTCHHPSLQTTWALSHPFPHPSLQTTCHHPSLRTTWALSCQKILVKSKWMISSGSN
ncbi:hypothetical protein AR679_gp098 [Yellowstone lake phycodnavirus 1]|uniref:hypothetical protein n=1 Tax=Yellowstone lake phycodnavirus 1 TaxID=1586713 RepID=UPI0006EB9DD9|nr:hypothetical protein AR679_gp098 [Yellowstone lake phycodnavirus 1]BAT22124.1 hypothetical protein [Yellowstone lake phycodnavirus 1]